jgi:hypothetical protein
MRPTCTMNPSNFVLIPRIGAPPFFVNVHTASGVTINGRRRHCASAHFGYHVPITSPVRPT